MIKLFVHKVGKPYVNVALILYLSWFWDKSKVFYKGEEYIPLQRELDFYRVSNIYLYNISAGLDYIFIFLI